MENNIIQVENVSKKFQFRQKGKTSIKKYIVDIAHKRIKIHKFHALKDISFTVKKGEFIGIIGPNGSGKSTLLRTIAGIYTPDSGRIVCNASISPMLSMGIGFNQSLTGRENIIISALSQGVTKKEIDALIEEIIEFSELNQFIDQEIKKYSSGMKSKLGFAITTALPRKSIFLMDEILAVGDDRFRQKSLTKLKGFLSKGKTILFVSHNLQHIGQYADKVLLLEKGEVIHFGEPASTISKYKEISKRNVS